MQNHIFPFPSYTLVIEIKVKAGKDKIHLLMGLKKEISFTKNYHFFLNHRQELEKGSLIGLSSHLVEDGRKPPKTISDWESKWYTVL